MNKKLIQIKIASLWVLLFFYGINIYAQSTTLQGTVVDSRTGDPLIGATIIVEGTTQGALSDLDGNFKISVASLPVSINTNLRNESIILIKNVCQTSGHSSSYISSHSVTNQYRTSSTFNPFVSVLMP